MANLGVIALAVLILALLAAATVPQAEGNDGQKVVISRFLADYSKAVKCTHKNKLCQKNTLNTKCCNHSCVNVLTNRDNCGRCGITCKYGQACCKGKCLNVTYDRNNCGGCGVTCSSGVQCRYKMCAYA